MKICGIISGPTLDEIHLQLEKAQKNCHLVEARVDLWDSPGFLSAFKNYSLPIILTVRRFEDGGAYRKSEEERLSLISKLLSFSPDYLDLELDVSESFLASINKQIKIIRSLHTKGTLDLKHSEELKKASGNIKKWVHTLHSSLDYFKMLEQMPKGSLVFGLGEKASFTRIIGAFFDVPWVYAPCDSKIKHLGQLSLEEIVSLYALEQKPLKGIYALLGDPLHLSPGYLVHNTLYRELELSLAYLNIPLRQEELKHFFDRVKKMPFLKGFSVTTPLKEVLFSYVENPESFDSINTLKRTPKGFEAENTDGIAACELLNLKEGDKLSIIGGGGTAKAIALAAHKRKANVSIFVRSPEKLKDFYLKHKIPVFSLEKIKDTDYLVNASTHLDPLENLPFANIYLEVNHKIDGFALKAQRQGKLIPGRALFLQQAMLQQLFWNEATIEDILPYFKRALKLLIKDQSGYQLLQSQL